jgi:hypothetical protein
MYFIFEKFEIDFRVKLSSIQLGIQITTFMGFFI